MVAESEPTITKTTLSLWLNEMKIIASLFVLMTLLINTAGASIKATDDTGTLIQLDHPATRVVSLSPGTTELVFAAGGGEKLRGVVSYSDYPAGAKQLPQVGSYNAIDIEKIVALKPDLIVGWESGNPPLQISKLKSLGLNVYLSEPREFSDIPATLKRLGALLGSEAVANKTALEFEQNLARLESKYSEANLIRKSVYIQIWNQPLMSINGTHLISRIVEFCGGDNIFHNVKQLTLSIDVETILEKNPDAIIASRQGDLGHQWLSRWKEWKFIAAVKNDALYAANPDHLVRHTPRIIQGIEQVCGFLQPQVK